MESPVNTDRGNFCRGRILEYTGGEHSVLNRHITPLV